MRKLTLGLMALLAGPTISQADIGQTMKEVLAQDMANITGWKPIQFHGCPALQTKSVTNGTVTLIFSPKTNAEIASILDSPRPIPMASTVENHVAKPTNSYGRWKIVQDDPKLVTWHLKHPRLGDLWMVSTGNAHVLIIATPEGLETLGLHAAKSPREKASTHNSKLSPQTP